MMGAFNRSALVTVVERRSRFLLFGDLPEGHDAQSVYACLIELTADLPDSVRRSCMSPGDPGWLQQQPLDGGEDRVHHFGLERAHDVG